MSLGKASSNTHKSHLDLNSQLKKDVYIQYFQNRKLIHDLPIVCSLNIQQTTIKKYGFFNLIQPALSSAQQGKQVSIIKLILYTATAKASWKLPKRRRMSLVTGIQKISPPQKKHPGFLVQGNSITNQKPMSWNYVSVRGLFQGIIKYPRIMDTHK